MALSLNGFGSTPSKFICTRERASACHLYYIRKQTILQTFLLTVIVATPSQLIVAVELSYCICNQTNGTQKLETFKRLQYKQGRRSIIGGTRAEEHLGRVSVNTLSGGIKHLLK